MTSPAPSSTTPDGALRLADWGVIRAQGPDAAQFLHSQLTQDVIGLRAGEARLAGYCSAKGRLLATFVIWKAADDEILLACSADLLPATLRRLSMFVMRAQCKLTDVTERRHLWGLCGESARTWLEIDATATWSVAARHQGQAVRLPDAEGSPRWLWLAPEAIDAAVPALPPLDAAQWSRLEVASGVVRIVAATVEAFVPQMVNLELVGGINFKKGCYPGQEVVARSQYRGTLKRRGVLLTGDTALAAGQEVFHSDDPGQPAGTIALATPGASGPQMALAELKRAALSGGSLHLGHLGGPLLSPQPLPYPVPVDEH